MLITLFAALVILALIVWAVPQIMTALSVPPPVATVIYVGLVVIIVLWLLSVLVGYSPGPLLHR